MNRDELVALVNGDIVGGNVVANNVCYGRTTDGLFTLTEEGQAAVLEGAKPKSKAAPKKAATKAAEPALAGDVDISGLDLE